MAQSRSSRTFEDKPAVRTAVPLLVGLCGPSGCGKTFSALRLATGIQRVTGGDIFMIDTEARRGLHYADQFRFRHVEFGAPFSPLDYLAAIEHCVKKGAKVLIVDSMSHEHEGPGGVLEMHEAELDRMLGNRKDDWNARNAKNFPAWARPKAERRRLINTILQLGINAVFCFRAKEKTKPGKERTQDGGEKSVLVPLGWMPIAGEEFVYEMTLNCVMYPCSGGVPQWSPEHVGEREMVKLPAQFRDLFAKSRAFDEDTGETMAKWAAGGASVAPANTPAPVASDKAPILRDIGKLMKAMEWPKEKGGEFMESLFGTADAKVLTVEQLTDAKALLEFRTQGEDEYNTERDVLAELGRVKPAEGKAAA